VDKPTTKLTSNKDKCSHVLQGVLDRKLVSRVKVVKEKEAELANVDEAKLKLGSLSALYGIQIGKTKVFLQRSAYEELEQARTDKLHVFAIRLQAIARQVRGCDYSCTNKLPD
jgi:myosin heavy subunit